MSPYFSRMRTPLAAVALLVTSAWACASPDEGSAPNQIVVPCDPTDPDACPPGDGFAQFCAVGIVNTCVNVCRNANIQENGCETDADCQESFMCDNDTVGGSSCKCIPGDDPCVPDFQIGGTEENPTIWEEKYTCVNAAGSCFSGGASDNNESITFSLVQNGKDVRGEIAFGGGAGDVFEGELCGSEFRWVDVTPGVQNPEEGCWTFTNDAFNKRSFATGEFDCVGIGTRGAGSNPPDVISCQDFGTISIPIDECPPPPPALPQDPS